jgi:di/tricarboxylate transporter
MASGAIITIVVILAAIVLFATELLSIDLVAMLIMISLVVTGVITPQQGVAGFSNAATITVAFMFVLSAALLKTGALQSVAHRLSAVFRENYRKGMVLMMLLMALISGFVNNTPVVAVFIPVVIQIAYASGQPPSKMLIPLSYASIMGGMCTLIGTSTNLLVSGIAEQSGLSGFGMFQLAPVGLPLLMVGMVFMLLIGLRILPARERDKSLSERFGMRDYLTELELLEGNELSGQRIMDSALVKELDMDIIEVGRGRQRYTLPPGDFTLQAGDLLKVRCDVAKVKALKERVKVIDDNTLKVGDNYLGEKNTALVELVVTAGSAFANRTLKSLDFRRTFRAIPLAIRHRNEVLHDHLYQIPLVAGDVILAEVKQHYIANLKQMEADQEAPFVLLSEDTLSDFNRRQFAIVMSVIAFVIIMATVGVLSIMVATILGVLALVLAGSMSMKEVYEAINWKIVFLLAGALSMGAAMNNTGLDQRIAEGLVAGLGQWGPAVVVAGLYLTTSLLTELMSNNATAALLAPIAIATAHRLDADPTPFLIAVTIAASASFMTPIGYQTNTMVYSAGDYRFRDFFRVGVGLNLLFWIVASLVIGGLYF